MRIDVFMQAGRVEPSAVAGRTAVVVDVIRATSTMVEALANGAHAIYPTSSTEEAIRLRHSLGPENTLLCGERKGMKVEGFDMGNSPAEYTSERVAGKGLVMSTTNGTDAFIHTAGASRVLAASFLNLSAVAQVLSRSSSGIAVICAGREGGFSLDDAVCAGYLVKEVLERLEAEPDLGDAARATLALAGHFGHDAAFLKSTAAGKALIPLGLDTDLDLCAQRDRHHIVPEMHDRVIRASKAEDP